MTTFMLQKIEEGWFYYHASAVVVDEYGKQTAFDCLLPNEEVDVCKKKTVKAALERAWAKELEKRHQKACCTALQGVKL